MTSAVPKPVAFRDRLKTEQSILEAAKLVLAEDGFGAFGVNAVARRAGCDKQLIYRYYAGLEGVVDAIGEDLAGLYAKLLSPPAAPAKTYAELAESLIVSLLDALRGSDLLARIAAWEIFDPSPVTHRLAASRGRALAAWVEARRGDLKPPPGVDVGAVNATLIAAAQHLALSARAVGGFGGVALESEADWDRIRAVLRALVRASFPTAGATADGER